MDPESHEVEDCKSRSVGVGNVWINSTKMSIQGEMSEDSEFPIKSGMTSCLEIQ